MGQRSVAPHSFNESLAASHKASDLPIWEEVYRAAFPAFQGMHDHRADGQHQRNGIDRSVVLSNGNVVWVDEKVRGRNKRTGKIYEDIALEYLSDVERNVPGWVCKQLLCDYIAYAIAPLGRGYLLPVIQLQAAWSKHGAKWIGSYPRIDAHNSTWITRSVGVPVGVLFPAIGEALRVSFTPCETDE